MLALQGMNLNRLLISFLILASLVSAALAFDKFYIRRDYIVMANIDCDPSQNSCFVGDGEDTPDYYAELSRPAYSISVCNGWADQCAPLTCDDGNPQCSIEYCTPGGDDQCSIDASSLGSEDSGE